jgi:hypothetical protein
MVAAATAVYCRGYNADDGGVELSLSSASTVLLTSTLSPFCCTPSVLEVSCAKSRSGRWVQNLVRFLIRKNDVGDDLLCLKGSVHRRTSFVSHLLELLPTVYKGALAALWPNLF